MTTFTDKFDRANADLHGSTWNVLDSSSTQAGILEIAETYLTQSSPANTESIAVVSNDLPTTAEQEVQAWVTSYGQGTNHWIEVCLGMSYGNGVWANRVHGISARITWLANGARRVSLLHQFSGESSQTTVVTADVLLDGGVPSDNYPEVFRNRGVVGEPQKLRLLVSAEDSGLYARVFVNEEDDDKPLFAHRLRSDWIAPDVTNTYGQWGLHFGPSATAGDLEVHYFGAEDYTYELREEIAVRDDQVTFRELIDRCKHIYSNGPVNANIDLDDSIWKVVVRDTVEDLINEAGDNAWFLRRSKTATIAPDSNRLVTLDPDVRRLLDLYYDGLNAKMQWRVHAYDASGNVVIKVIDTGASTVRMVYILRHRQMEADDDPCPIPREHAEIIAYGACLRVAERDRSERLVTAFAVRYQILKKQYLRDLNRDADAARPVMRPIGFRADRARRRWPRYWP